MLHRAFVICLGFAASSTMPIAARAGMNHVVPFTGSEVSLSFSYNVKLSGSHFDLRDSEGREVVCAGVRQGDEEGEVIIVTHDRLEPGSYTLTWQVSLTRSSDKGSLSFEISN